jgi:hypothetical protein
MGSKEVKKGRTNKQVDKNKETKSFKDIKGEIVY